MKDMNTTTMTDGTEKTYLSCAETAKLLRRALKAAFPGVKFSVRSDTYSMGASIDVGYTDGPPQKAVERVASRYRGADFDGSIDLKTYRGHYLLPDGTLAFGPTQGTQGSGGYIPAEAPERPAGAVLVQLGADHVFVRREYSPGAEAMIWQRARCKGAPAGDQHDPERWSYFHRASEEFDFRGGKPRFRADGWES